MLVHVKMFEFTVYMTQFKDKLVVATNQARFMINRFYDQLSKVVHNITFFFFKCKDGKLYIIIILLA